MFYRRWEAKNQGHDARIHRARDDACMSPRRPDLQPLRRQDLDADPIAQFAAWYELAVREVPLAEAMTLATTDPEGVPDARMVLLKGVGPDGFRFFSNYESAKGRELEARPVAALVIYWRELDRQVRVRGEVSRLPEADSDAYFASRPRGSQIAASVSPQSTPIEREDLERLYAQAGERLGEGEVPRPPHWGGYLVAPEAIELWQGRDDRMHDRFLYVREGDGWAVERLAP
jgi:pyridoxamine 5'-phosphate oxidase